MTDQQLQLALAKMLPDKITLAAEFVHEGGEVFGRCFQWNHTTVKDVERIGERVTSREWLHVCWLVEQTITTTEQQNKYQSEISDICWGDEDRANNQVVFNQLTASWQQRAEALCRVKGITPL